MGDREEPAEKTREETVAERRARLVEICGGLPEVTVRDGQHIAFDVRGRRFAYYLDDHHGDGRVALCCKAAPGVLGMLIEEEPDRFYAPAYLGPKGWVAMRLDLDDLDWDEVTELVRDAYRMQVPKRLAAQVAPSSSDAGDAGRAPTA